MEVLGFISIIAIILFGIFGAIALIGGLADGEPGIAFIGLGGVCIALACLASQCHVSEKRDSLVLITSENVVKKDGVYTIKYFDKGEKEYFTSEYNDSQLLNDMSNNQICIKITKEYDVYGAEFSNPKIKVSLCKENSNLIEESK